ncbi:MAG: hypothetical protein J0H86_03090 [Xanthomonadaceae bacterium]|nr:hypothetical protein [Xanthomonadaceae bacterium]
MKTTPHVTKMLCGASGGASSEGIGVAQESSVNIKNPARWLLNLWGRLPNPSSVPSDNVIAGWAKAFGLEPGDPRVFAGLRAVDFMMRKAQDQVSSMPFPGNVGGRYLEWVKAFQHALSYTSTSTSWRDLYTGFSAARFMRLQDAADWLDVYRTEEVATQQELDELVRSMADLHGEISAADINEEFKRLLLDMVEAMRRALAEYQVSGQSGVADAMGDIMARILSRPDVLKKNAASPWLDKVIDAGKKFIKFGADIKDTYEVIGGSAKFLLEHLK